MLLFLVDILPEDPATLTFLLRSHREATEFLPVEVVVPPLAALPHLVDLLHSGVVLPVLPKVMVLPLPVDTEVSVVPKLRPTICHLLPVMVLLPLLVLHLNHLLSMVLHLVDSALPVLVDLHRNLMVLHREAVADLLLAALGVVLGVVSVEVNPPKATVPQPQLPPKATELLQVDSVEVNLLKAMELLPKATEVLQVDSVEVSVEVNLPKVTVLQPQPHPKATEPPLVDSVEVNLPKATELLQVDSVEVNLLKTMELQLLPKATELLQVDSVEVNLPKATELLPRATELLQVDSVEVSGEVNPPKVTVLQPLPHPKATEPPLVDSEAVSEVNLPKATELLPRATELLQEVSGEVNPPKVTVLQPQPHPKATEPPLVDSVEVSEVNPLKATEPHPQLPPKATVPHPQLPPKATELPLVDSVEVSEVNLPKATVPPPQPPPKATEPPHQAVANLTPATEDILTKAARNIVHK